MEPRRTGRDSSSVNCSQGLGFYASHLARDARTEDRLFVNIVSPGSTERAQSKLTFIILLKILSGVGSASTTVESNSVKDIRLFTISN